MNHSYAFGELAQSLSLSRNADNVVLAIAKVQNGRDLTDTDKIALQFAVDFLREVHLGSRWSSEEQPTINQDSARKMSYFVRAAETLSRAQSSGGLVANIEGLLRSAEAAKAGNAQVPDLQHLRRFFGSILKATLDQLDRSFASSNKLRAQYLT